MLSMCAKEQFLTHILGQWVCALFSTLTPADQDLYYEHWGEHCVQQATILMTCLVLGSRHAINHVWTRTQGGEERVSPG